MAEIKSTLDLIMERTKNLTMSDEERKTFQLDELKGKVRGWVRRYLDGSREADDLERDFAGGAPDRATLLRLTREEALAQIEPDGENVRILGLLAATGEDTGPLVHRIEVFQEAMREKAAVRQEIAMAALAEKGVRGPAIIANPEKDPAWKKERAASVDAFKRELIGS